jgi:hypothetical protein
MHGFGSMASGLQFGFSPKVQHCPSNRSCHALMTAGLRVGSLPSPADSPWTLLSEEAVCPSSMLVLGACASTEQRRNPIKK